MKKIEIPCWTKVFFYMLEHCPKSSEHRKFVDVKFFDQIGFPNTLLKGAACVPGDVRKRQICYNQAKTSSVASGVVILRQAFTFFKIFKKKRLFFMGRHPFM